MGNIVQQKVISFQPCSLLMHTDIKYLSLPNLAECEIFLDHDIIKMTTMTTRICHRTGHCIEYW